MVQNRLRLCARAVRLHLFIGAAPVAEDVLDRQLKEPRNLEGEGKGRVMLARFDGVDRLA